MQKIKKAKGKLIPDIVLGDSKMHAMTSSAFAPNKRQTRREGFSNKLGKWWYVFSGNAPKADCTASIDIGQLASYMDDHYSRYGLFTIYEYTWFVKRHDDTHFLMSPPISATALCSQCYSARMAVCHGNQSFRRQRKLLRCPIWAEVGTLWRSKDL